MKHLINQISKNHGLIYKILLFTAVAVLFIYVLPEGSHFSQDIRRGQAWAYDDLYAPFDFAVLKDKDQMELEREEIRSNKRLYFDYSDSIRNEVFQDYADAYTQLIRTDSTTAGLYDYGLEALQEVYGTGVVRSKSELDLTNSNRIVTVRRGNDGEDFIFSDLYNIRSARFALIEKIRKSPWQPFLRTMDGIFLEALQQNVIYNSHITDIRLQEQLDALSDRSGMVIKGQRIVSKGEVVTEEIYRELISLKGEYEGENRDQLGKIYTTLGYGILIFATLFTLFFYLMVYRKETFERNSHVTFIMINMVIMVVITVIAAKYDTDMIYIVPLCIQPLVLRSFFDTRLAFYVHLVTVLITSFMASNSFQFVYVQLIAGMVTILSAPALYHRAMLFITVGKITLAYIVINTGLMLVQEGRFTVELGYDLGYFMLNGLLTLFAQPLVYIYEKTFGLVSDVSLLELSDTNSTLLRKLAVAAPGSFQHSMSVANLAEEAAREIDANALLVRVGALYHDIGKMQNPLFFTENQGGGHNPHDELEPQESAQIIVGHVLHGIEMARKHHLPERIIDFIRTHHGESLVYFFYKKDVDERGEDAVDMADYRYPGPKPFSKEMAVLMMCDSVEAASRSIKEPTSQNLEELVERIIDGQLKGGQFDQAAITFREISTVKKVLIHKLKNIYHVRIEYPE